MKMDRIMIPVSYSTWASASKASRGLTRITYRWETTALNPGQKRRHHTVDGRESLVLMFSDFLAISISISIRERSFSGEKAGLEGHRDGRL